MPVSGPARGTGAAHLGVADADGAGELFGSPIETLLGERRSDEIKRPDASIMYQPDAFAVTDPAEIEVVLRSLRFGCLVTHDAEGLFATHMPFLYDAERQVLTGHMARANLHWRRAGEAVALAIFQGEHAYVSPSWYPSKAKHGRVVPTWNYEAAHLGGRLSWRHDADWLIAHVGALTDRQEASMPEPWALSDAPADYIRGLAAGIVGLELNIDRVEIKRKLSQNRPESDRQGVIAGLSASTSETDRQMAAAMADKARS